MFWNPFTCFLKSFFSFTINFILTFSCHSSSFSISHTKHIISLDSSVYTTVTWNWFTKSLNLSWFFHWVYSEECCGSVILGLSSIWWWDGMEFGIVIGLFTIIFDLFLKSRIWNWSTIKRMNLGWWDWLKKLKIEIKNTFCNRI